MASSGMAKAIRTLYRVYLKQARNLAREELAIEFRTPLDKDAWLGTGMGSKAVHGWAKTPEGANTTSTTPFTLHVQLRPTSLYAVSCQKCNIPSCPWNCRG
jgi:hypothetical protein